MSRSKAVLAGLAVVASVLVACGDGGATDPGTAPATESAPTGRTSPAAETTPTDSPDFPTTPTPTEPDIDVSENEDPEPPPVADPLFLVGTDLTGDLVADYARDCGGLWDPQEIDCDNGVEILGDAMVGLVSQVNLYPDYPGPLPAGLSWTDTPDDLLGTWGEPAVFNESEPMAGLPGVVRAAWNLDLGNVRSVWAEWDPDTLELRSLGFSYGTAEPLP